MAVWLGPQDDADSIATIRRAIDRGINWIDTAAVYGLGHSEEVIGRALSDIPRANGLTCSRSAALSGTTPEICRTASVRTIRREIEQASAVFRPTASTCTRFTGPRGRPVRRDTIPAQSKRRGKRSSSFGAGAKPRHRRVELRCAQLERIQRIETPTNLQPPYSLLRREIEEESCRSA